MTADIRFRDLPRSFWADVRTISESVGYSKRRTKEILVPAIRDVQRSYGEMGFDCGHLLDDDRTTAHGAAVLDYFAYRATILNEYVEPRLMDVDRAKSEFERHFAELRPTCPIPMNKQKGEKKAPAYFTGLVNMLVESHACGISCDYDPRRLTTVTRDRAPLRTLSRRVDGAFPSVVDPVAVWEIKEYYYTTTFGSRVAGGVYETLLDGMELEELAHSEDVRIRHYLMIDSHYTWWTCGRSYLCRMIDLIHMGYVDEVLFGYEIVERLPQLVEEWVSELRLRDGPSG